MSEGALNSARAGGEKIEAEMNMAFGSLNAGFQQVIQSVQESIKVVDTKF